MCHLETKENPNKMRHQTQLFNKQKQTNSVILLQRKLFILFWCLDPRIKHLI